MSTACLFKDIRFETFKNKSDFLKKNCFVFVKGSDQSILKILKGQPTFDFQEVMA